MWDSPYINHFISADTVVPDPYNPQAWNRYSYTLNNPIRYADPSGHWTCAEEDDKGSCVSGAQVLKHDIQSKYKKVKIKGHWSETQLLKLFDGLDKIMGKNGFNGNMDAFDKVFGSVTFALHDFKDDNQAGDADWNRQTGAGTIQLDPGLSDWTTVVHEMGHLFSWTDRREHKNDSLPSYTQMYSNIFDAGPGATGYARDTKSPTEDFADSFLAVIRYGPQTNKIDINRINVITFLIQSYTIDPADTLPYV